MRRPTEQKLYHSTAAVGVGIILGLVLGIIEYKDYVAPFFFFERNGLLATVGLTGISYVIIWFVIRAIGSATSPRKD